MQILRIPLFIILIVGVGRTFNAGAQTVTNLYSFVGSPTDGEYPFAGLVQGSDGNFYGTTLYGGANNSGTVFRISPGGSETILYSFVGLPDDGYEPDGVVQGSDGNFYGTTEHGGKSGDGTVFRISPSGSYTNLYSFGGSPSDGEYPNAGLVQGRDGNFYGTTWVGGMGTNIWGGGAGTVFRISPSGSETPLYSFGSYPSDGSDGWDPMSGLVQGSDGNFYGTTSDGGTNHGGTVFRISPSGAYTTLHRFGTSPNDGWDPMSGLVQGSDGNFYGTTAGGGTTGVGTIFRISPSGSYTSLYSFAGSPTDGENPRAGLVQGSDGNFYGTAGGGTYSQGSLFRIGPSGSYTNLYSFVGSPTDGSQPYELVQASDGNFYSTTHQGGASTNCDGGCGTVFKLTVPLNPPANQISGIHFFNVLDSTIVAVPIPSVAGETYQLQYSDSLSPVNWLNTGGTITSIGGPLVLIDIAEPLPPQRFYRFAITP